VLVLREASGPMTVEALTKYLVAAGVPLGPKANKRVADTLRWEVKCKRVWKHGRGLYSYAGMRDSTLRWMRQEAARIAPRLAPTLASMAPPPLRVDARIAQTLREAEEAFAAHPERFAYTLPATDDGGDCRDDGWRDGGCGVSVGAIEAALRDFERRPL
jgi:hypothetical protein